MCHLLKILEKKVKDNDKKDRFIDIVIKFFNKDNLNDPLGIVCIENKINSIWAYLSDLSEACGVKLEEY